MIEVGTGQRPNIDDLPVDDPGHLPALQRGDTLVSSSSKGANMRALVRSLAPTTLVTWPPWWRCTAPGPWRPTCNNDYADRKNGRQPITYLHPDLPRC